MGSIKVNLIMEKEIIEEKVIVADIEGENSNEATKINNFEIIKNLLKNEDLLLLKHQDGRQLKFEFLNEEKETVT